MRMLGEMGLLGISWHRGWTRMTSSAGRKMGFQWGVIYSPEEALEDTDFRARGMWVEVEHPDLEASFNYPGALCSQPGGGRRSLTA